MPPEAAAAAADKKALPALYTYLTRVYTAMKDEAEQAPIDTTAELVEFGLIYEGHLTQLFRELSIPNPYYTSVTRTLKAMECIVQLRRGGGPSQSRWILLGPPTEEGYLAAASTSKQAHRHKGKQAMLEQRVRDLTQRVELLESINASKEQGERRQAIQAEGVPSASDGAVRTTAKVELDTSESVHTQGSVLQHGEGSES